LLDYVFDEFLQFIDEDSAPPSSIKKPPVLGQVVFLNFFLIYFSLTNLTREFLA